MTAIERYVTKNPMRVEARRSFRKFIGMGKVTQAAVRRGATLLGLMYIVLMCIFLYLAQYIPPVVSTNLEIFGLLATGTIGFYSAVSGERERRTWDVLRALPITNGQIIGGKFLGGAAVIGLVWLALLPYTLINALIYDESSIRLYYSAGNLAAVAQTSKLGAWVLDSLITLMVGLFALGLTLLLSTRVKRSISALGISLGTIFVWIALLPSLLGGLLSFDRSGEILTEASGNPFLVVSMIHRLTDTHSNSASSDFYIPPSVIVIASLVYVLVLAALTLVFIVWADRTLTFAEDQVEFIRRKDNA